MKTGYESRLKMESTNQNATYKHGGSILQKMGVTLGEGGELLFRCWLKCLRLKFSGSDVKSSGVTAFNE